MKLGFKLGNIEYNEIKLSNVELNVQFSAEELVAEYDLLKRIAKELPEICTDLANGAVAFAEIDKAFTKYTTAVVAEDSTEETKTTAMDLVKSAINKINQAV